MIFAGLSASLAFISNHLDVMMSHSDFQFFYDELLIDGLMWKGTEWNNVDSNATRSHMSALKDSRK